MEKVICIKCGSIGYTASPEKVRCSECGGKHKIIKEIRTRFSFSGKKVISDESISRDKKKPGKAFLG
jgi:uncharacterized OB-fold protein